MNKMTNLQRALDLALAGSSKARSRFKIVQRTYNEESNCHEIMLKYSFRKHNDMPIEKTGSKPPTQRGRLYNEIMKATKLNSKDSKRK